MKLIKRDSKKQDNNETKKCSCDSCDCNEDKTVTKKPNKHTVISNIVDDNTTMEVQSATLDIISRALIKSFGPIGSNSVYDQGNGVIKYTKDGHTILKNIKLVGEIENAVRNELEELTRNITITVGDGTTSAIILSKIIFDKLKDLTDSYTPYEIIENLKKAVTLIKEEIISNKRDFDFNIAYDIASISTNGNKEVATNISNIYKEYGNDVFIDVGISNTNDSLLKTYDGMTLETGYSDTAYINNTKKGCCTLNHPRVYYFEDPIDTPEMFSFLDTIIKTNIVSAYNTQDPNIKPIPTVILTPRLSKDMGSYLVSFIEWMYKFGEGINRPPFLLITNIYDKEILSDITRMCGCKNIKKYINPDQQQLDIDAGLAPTIETVCSFYGEAEMVESDITKTKFVNPKNMFTENHEYSNEFNTLINFLESELDVAYKNNEDANVTGNLKRRINSLKANMVEYLVGGVSISERDNLRDLVEDAVLNCRSAARYGYGWGANLEGYLAICNIDSNDNIDDFIHIIENAYYELLSILYGTLYKDKYLVEVTISNCKETGLPFNIKTKHYDSKVVSSIMSDVIILDTVSKIISLMFTSNQFLCSSPIENRYKLFE